MSVRLLVPATVIDARAQQPALWSQSSFAGVRHCLIWKRRPRVLSIRHCVAIAVTGRLGVLRFMQYWKVVVLCGLTVGTSVTWCRPQIEKQFNSRFNITGSEIHMRFLSPLSL